MFFKSFQDLAETECQISMKTSLKPDKAGSKNKTKNSFSKQTARKKWRRTGKTRERQEGDEKIKKTKQTELNIAG